MKCAICNKEIKGYPHNGRPLVDGQVCENCNWKVIQERMRRIKEAEAEEPKDKPAEEAVATVGSGGPVPVVDPIKDFEKYAEEFEKTFILGNTPVHKEEAENKTKVKNGEVTGEIDSMAKGEKAEQVKPISATESINSPARAKELREGFAALQIDSPMDLVNFMYKSAGIDVLPYIKETLNNK